MALQRKYVLLVLITSMMFILYACSGPAATQDPNAKITEIAATVQAELTRVYALTPSVTPTLTPTVTSTLSSETPTLTSTLLTPTATKSYSTLTSGDNSKYNDDITIPDGSLVLPGSTFEKTWSVLNNGTTTWNTNYQIKYIDGTPTQTLFFKLTKDVAPGELAQITIKFVAPSTNGSYVSWWKLENADGYLFGDPLSIAFVVGTETLTPTTTAATPTVTPTTATPKE